jgi:hypothetical protein
VRARASRWVRVRTWKQEGVYEHVGVGVGVGIECACRFGGKGASREETPQQKEA